jgi:adenine phosphoribosyltransferase
MSSIVPTGSSVSERIANALRVVPDFPQPGIQFLDITPVLADAALLRDTIAEIAAPWRSSGVTHVAGIESRGFILAAPVAVQLGAGFIPIRKPGKLPWRTASRDYALEYGSGTLEMHADACPEAARVLIVDDVLATGGTAEAACALVESVGGSLVGCHFLLSIAALAGASRIAGYSTRVMVER